MRIAVVEGRQTTPIAGATLSDLLGTPVEHLVRELEQLGHVVQHLRLSPPPSAWVVDDRPDELAVARAGHRHLVVAAGRELSVLRAFAPDSVLAVGQAAGRLLDELTPGLRTHWVWTPGAERCAGPDGLSAWLPATSARVVVASRAEREMLARAGLPRARCDVAAWHLSSREAWSRPEEPAVVRTLLTAADGDGDGVTDVVRALALLPGLRLVVAVDPASAADPGRVRPWTTLAAGLGIRQRVWAVAVRSATAVRTLMADADLLVSVPRGETRRELVATAMWSGLPVVVGDHDDARELVETGCSGLVLPTGDCRRLARALHVVRDDATGRTSWARAARRHAAELLSPEETALTVARALATSGRAAHVRPRSVPGARRSSTFRAARAG